MRLSPIFCFPPKLLTHGGGSYDWSALYRYLQNCYAIKNLRNNSISEQAHIVLFHKSSTSRLQISLWLGHLSPAVCVSSFYRCCAVVVYSAIPEIGDSRYNSRLLLFIFCKTMTAPAKAKMTYITRLFKLHKYRHGSINITKIVSGASTYNRKIKFF